MKLSWKMILCAMLLIPLAGFGQVLSVTPADPAIGATLTITYHADAPGAALAKATGLSAEVLLMLTPELPDLPVLVTVPLSAVGKTWTGTMTLSDERARFLLFRVVAGDAQDNNDGNVWSTAVYGADGKPLEGAMSLSASLLAGNSFMEFKHSKDLGGAHAAIARERELYPNSWRSYPTEWMVLSRELKGDELMARITASLDSYYDRFKGNEEAMAVAINWFERVGQKDRSDTLAAAFIARNPKGKMAETVRRNAAYAERNPGKRAETIEKFLTDFPQKGMVKENLEAMLASSLIQSNQAEKAADFLEKSVSPNVSLLNRIAWEWIEKGENLLRGIALARKGVDVSTNPPASARPTYLSEQKWKEQTDESRAMILDTYAYGLQKQKNYPEAEAAAMEAYKLTSGSQPELTERLMTIYNEAGKAAEALAVGTKAIETGKSSANVIAQFKAAYTKINGSDKGFDKKLAASQDAGKKAMLQQLAKDRLSTPATPFSLKDLNGKTVTLAGLKGKVVVVDFWATWCGPCKMSFPTLQEVYNKYKANKKVAILTLNTWERVSGAERETTVKKFIADNKYTFPVLYDEGVVEKYGVDGIPTKFIIDKKGNIAFKSIGFDSADTMREELTAQIDMLLAE